MREIQYISTYVPRKCGIATFCRDLLEGVEKNDQGVRSEVAALVTRSTERLDYPPVVDSRVRRNVLKDYKSLAERINNGPVEVVSVQHEYGIFGGEDGEYITRLMDAVQKPMVSTLHTILPEPTEGQKQVLQGVIERSTAVVAMLEAGADILENVYGIDGEKVVVIPHGVPNFEHDRPEACKEELGLVDRQVMVGVNLLSPGKGVEYGIRALPEIVKQVPNILYLVVGETHPDIIKAYHGKDVLRSKLQHLARRLKVEDHVKFINEYVSVPDLVKYVVASDIYITPYLDPQQATSGALAYAIGAGKACISTPYMYAQEMLSNDSGVLVPFKNSEAIAEAVIALSKDSDHRKAIEKNAILRGREMSWKVVGKSYLELFNQMATNNQS